MKNSGDFQRRMVPQFVREAPVAHVAVEGGAVNDVSRGSGAVGMELRVFWNNGLWYIPGNDRQWVSIYIYMYI